MRLSIGTLLIFGALGAGGALAQAPTADQLNDPNLIGLQTPNGRVVYDFIDLMFNQDKPGEAFDKYVSRDDYMDHAVYSASTNKKQSFAEERAAEVKATFPGEHFVFKQMVAEGDLVISHIFASNSRNPVGNELIEIERLKDGKIVDHWDIHVPLKPDSMVFLGLNR